MASAASPSIPSGGVATSMWASQPPSKSGWGRSGESAQAFSGMSRGRPGRGGGRGGRPGRGGSTAGPNSARPVNEVSKPNGISKGTQAKERPLKPSAAMSATPDAPTPASAAAAPVPSKPLNRPKETKPPPRKVSEAKPSRKLPPIVVDSPPVPPSQSPVSASTLSATTPTGNRNRRKRAQTQNRGAPSNPSKKSPSSESSSSHIRPEKSPVIVKDLPPHLAPPPRPETPSFHIKHDINALVERVRAVAMDRPNTPGSHIDWAGDDDDSLPDLDDWGVKSVTDQGTSSVPPEQPDLISPILADALKPLPNIEFCSPLAVTSTAPVEEITAAEIVVPPVGRQPKEVEENTLRCARVGPHTVEETGKIQAQIPKESDAAAKSYAPGFSVNSTVAPEVTAKKSPLKQSHLPLHPSLPPKPVDAIDALSTRVPREPVPVLTPDPATTIEEPNKSGLSESMHAPNPNGTITQDQANETSSSLEPQGVTGSSHAPIRSAPSQYTTHPGPPFYPTHGRAHTLGRPNGLRVPFSSSHNSLPDGSTDERVSRRDRINHARNHSSPPTGPGTATAHARTTHASRPVITGAALSRLARTLGGPGPSSTKRAEPAATTVPED